MDAMPILPIFPLPLVLLPGAVVPLHIFEPRYRQMVAHCIEADRRFAQVYHDPDESGPFRVEGQIGCVAEIGEWQPIPDGRSLITVEGHGRVLLREDVGSDKMYYVSEVEAYEDVDPEPPGILERRADTIDRFRRAIGRISSSPEGIPVIDPSREASFQLARWIQAPPHWYKQLLESRAEVERLDVIDELLYEALDRLP
jgi:Lon protease-like protein